MLRSIPCPVEWMCISRSHLEWDENTHCLSLATNCLIPSITVHSSIQTIAVIAFECSFEDIQKAHAVRLFEFPF